METESKVFCSGQLRSVEVYVYYINRQPQNSTCVWDVDVGLFRTDPSTDTFTLVSGSSTGPLRGEGADPSGREYASTDFDSSGPPIETGDLFAVQIHIVSGDCLALPFPVNIRESMVDTIRASSVPAIFVFQFVNNTFTISHFSPITSDDLGFFNHANLSFDASIQLTGKIYNRIQPAFLLYNYCCVLQTFYRYIKLHWRVS